MSNNDGVYNVTGQLQVAVSSSLAKALGPPSGSLNIRRFPERNRYNKLLLGTALRSEVGEYPYTDIPATVPSWTQIEAEKKHAFIIGELSSSDHECTSLNAFRSGTVRLEGTQVAASGTSYYSKRNSLQKLTYKLSASALLPGFSDNENTASTYESAARANTEFIEGSGSYRNNSYWNPAVFDIDVQEYGKIRDIKVWVEFIHDHRGGTGTGSADASNIFWSGGVGVAARDLDHGL